MSLVYRDYSCVVKRTVAVQVALLEVSSVPKCIAGIIGSYVADSEYDLWCEICILEDVTDTLLHRIDVEYLFIDGEEECSIEDEVGHAIFFNKSQAETYVHYPGSPFHNLWRIGHYWSSTAWIREYLSTWISAMSLEWIEENAADIEVYTSYLDAPEYP